MPNWGSGSDGVVEKRVELVEGKDQVRFCDRIVSVSVVVNEGRLCGTEGSNFE